MIALQIIDIFFFKSQFILNQAEQGHFHKVSVYTRSFFFKAEVVLKYTANKLILCTKYFKYLVIPLAQAGRLLYVHYWCHCLKELLWWIRQIWRQRRERKQESANLQFTSGIQKEWNLHLIRFFWAIKSGSLQAFFSPHANLTPHTHAATGL